MGTIQCQRSGHQQGHLSVRSSSRYMKTLALKMTIRKELGVYFTRTVTALASIK